MRTYEELYQIYLSCPVFEIPEKNKTSTGQESSSEKVEGEFLSNGFIDEESTVDGENHKPLLIQEIIGEIQKRSNGWPKRIGSALFIYEHGRKSVDWLTTPAALFGWLNSSCGMIEWRRGVGFVTKEEVFHELCRTSTEYKAIEYLPHYPLIEGHYYACDIPEAGDGSTISVLIRRFCPDTPIDRQLMLLMFATPFWGGRGGTRPGFVITSTGRGCGKSTLTEVVSSIAGGYVEIREYEDASTMRQRLLSEEAMPKRIARLDNVKSLKFSWSDLESTMTAESLSGKRMYYGETSRPNTLTWFITLNGISLSTDMAQRCVILRVAKPTHEGRWEEETFRFIEQNRQKIIGDILGFLRITDEAKLEKNSRWGAWESGVLCRLPNAAAVQAAIMTRAEKADTELEESIDLEQHFREKLESLGYETELQKVHIPNEVAAIWYREVTNEKNKNTMSCCKIIHQFCEEERFKKLKNNPSRKYGRGFLWIGSDVDADYDLKDRIETARKLQRETRYSSEHWQN